MTMNIAHTWAALALSLGLTSAVAAPSVPTSSASPGMADPAASSVADDPRMAGFKGKIAQRYEDSREDWPQRPKAPAGAPNILLILLDDVGYAQIGSFGGLIKTSNIDALAADGLRY